MFVPVVAGSTFIKRPCAKQGPPGGVAPGVRPEMPTRDGKKTLAKDFFGPLGERRTPGTTPGIVTKSNEMGIRVEKEEVVPPGAHEHAPDRAKGGVGTGSYACPQPEDPM